MSKIVDESLQKMVKSTAIIFFGTIMGMAISFFGRIVVVRYISTKEYGLLSMALVLFNVFVMISMLGLPTGVTRQIAYFKGINNDKKVKSVIISSIQISVISSIIFFLIVYLISDFISITFFHDIKLSHILKILCFAIPFTVLFNIVMSIFRGFGIVSVKVFFNDILRNSISLILFLVVIFLNLPFIWIVYAYLLALVITSISLIIYGLKKFPRIEKTKTEPMKKELLYFSLPLFGQGILTMVVSSTDTLMLGYFKNPDIVGLYNAALPIANLIPIFLTSLSFIYVPVLTQLYSKNQYKEIKRTYYVITKWVFSATLPIFMIMFLFPDSVLNILFGDRYIQADIVLRLLAIGFFSHTFLGPNGMTLLVLGKTKLIFINVFLRAVLNIILNFLLIPSMGLEGAAVASAITLIFINVLNSAELYILSKIHPFNKNYLKPVIMSIILIFSIYIFTKTHILNIWMLLLISGLFAIIYVLFMVFTKCIDKEDFMILEVIERKTGINLEFIKKL